MCAHLLRVAAQMSPLGFVATVVAGLGLAVAAGIAACGTAIANVEAATATRIVEVNNDFFTSVLLLEKWLAVFPHEAKI
jgi:hypothetical protein